MLVAGLVNNRRPRRYQFGGYIARRQGGGPAAQAPANQKLSDLFDPSQTTSPFADTGDGSFAQQNAAFWAQPATPELQRWGESVTARWQPNAIPFGGWADNTPNTSTDNWRLLPAPYNNPGYKMRNGRIINTYSPGYRMGLPAEGAYTASFGSGDNTTVVFGHGGAGHGYPTSVGSGAVRAYYWPGQIEPPDVEGGTGTYRRGGWVW